MGVSGEFTEALERIAELEQALAAPPAESR